MKILILGGDGMLGHQLLFHFSTNHEVRVTLRQDESAYRHFNIFNLGNSYFGVDIRSLARLIEVFSEFRPDVVINAIGIVKQRPDAKESVPSLEINSLLPHRLALICKATNARLIHLSTDCVFSGMKGNYQENDPSDATDLYGKSKFLGELHDTNCLTLRTSIIGRELSRHTSLVDWFLNQHGTINGYTNAIYTGFTTLEISRIIEELINKHTTASGLYQVSSYPINKFELLHLLKSKFKSNVEIVPYSEFYCNRSLDSTRFRNDFGYRPPSWSEMIGELNI